VTVICYEMTNCGVLFLLVIFSRVTFVSISCPNLGHAHIAVTCMLIGSLLCLLVLSRVRRTPPREN